MIQERARQTHNPKIRRLLLTILKSQHVVFLEGEVMKLLIAIT